MQKKNILNLFLTISISTIVGLLIYKQLLYPTIIPMVIKGGASLFADWTVILNANNCLANGYDVYLENPCDHWNRKHVYGEILLNIPYIKTFPKFYYLIFPIIINVLFIYSIVDILFNIENKKLWLILLIFIFNVPVLLAIERANNDIFIFLFMYVICKYNNHLINYSLILLSALSKIYPILLSVIFLFEKKYKKIFINLSLISIIFLILIGIQLESFLKVFENQGQFTGYGFGLYEFSFLGFIEFFKSLNIKLREIDLNMIKYIYLLLFILLPTFYLNYIYSKKIYSIFNNFSYENNYNFENKLYFLSSTIILFCYISFSNFIYREIFFIGLIPAILSFKKSNDEKFLSYYFILLMVKFLISSIFIYFSQNGIFKNFEPFMIIFKHTIDLLLISLVLHIYIYLITMFVKKNFKKLPN